MHRAISSAVERLVYTENVGGSIPSSPTTLHEAKSSDLARGAAHFLEAGQPVRLALDLFAAADAEVLPCSTARPTVACWAP
jgi:hypothetical protein